MTLVASGFGLTFGPAVAASFLAVGTAIWKPVSDLGLEMRNIAMWRPDAQSPLVRPLITDLVRESGPLLPVVTEVADDGTSAVRQNSSTTGGAPARNWSGVGSCGF